MKTNFYITLVVIWSCLLFSCKKVSDNANNSIDDREIKAQKYEFYNSRGLKYLFTLNRGEADSVSPIYFGKTTKGEIHYILESIKNGQSNTIARIYNGSHQNWELAGLDISKLKMNDFYTLSPDDFLEVEAHENPHYYFLYKEKTGVNLTYKWKSSIGDSLSIKKAYYIWKSQPKELNKLYYQHGNFKLNEPYIYNGGLYEYSGSTYLLYFLPTDLESSNTISNLHLMVRSNSGLEYQKILETSQGAAFMDGGMEVYIEGQKIQLIETGNANPMFMFWSGYNSFSQQTVSFWKSIKTDIITSVTFPFKASEMKFFTLKDQIYGNTTNALFQVSGANSITIPTQLTQKTIRGIFGNSRAVLLVVEAENKDLDIVEMKL